MKKITASLVMIVVTMMAATTATYAYFSAGKVLGTSDSVNTFATGSVSIGGFNIANLNVSGLVPGVPKMVSNVGINYTGNINADLFIGAGGTSSPGDPTYLANKVYLRIYKQGTTDIVWEGLVQALSTNWTKVANNVGAGWQAYDLQFTLDSSASNSMQGVTNTDTKILVYAVQTGYSAPTTVPYLVDTSTNWW
jgi:hypothetical protein